MAVREFKTKPVIYSNVVEGREALWKSLKSSYSRRSVPPTKKSRPVQNFCDSSQYEYQCNDVENKRRKVSGQQLPPPLVMPLTSDDSTTASTSSLTSMSSLTSTSSMTTPPPPPPLLSPPPLKHRSASLHSSWSSAEVHRLRRRASVVHAICWPEDEDDKGRRHEADENEGGDEDENEGGDEDDGKSPPPPMVEDDDGNEPTLVLAYDDDQRFSNYTGMRRLFYDDDEGSATTVSENTALSKYQMRVKEVDENILFYSKRFLCAFMFFVLLRVFF